MRKHLLAALAAISMTSLGLMAAPAASANASVAAACDNNFIGGPNNSSGSLQAQSGAVWHKGPGANYCTIPSQSGLAYVWCYTTSSSGNFWYLARDSNTSQLGWIWAAYVNSTSGSINHC
ncbi:hypothetical protein LZG04_11320 [Saccharothrix sp. S26]|uniref:hypothetical protein n=1 Tax=Saccharothrix sp. S26 TaxID=2907215 RepID=UPI001F3DC8B7|nr:hypothetical protein [Saccharothrix sp. S26]MCE6995393.1 hypothetical protein [Saccharothrix sp. S26]